MADGSSVVLDIREPKADPVLKTYFNLGANNDPEYPPLMSNYTYGPFDQERRFVSINIELGELGMIQIVSPVPE
jgi:hypothetical protein